MTIKRKLTPKSRIMMISPALALKWLETMRVNRRCSQGLINAISRDIRTGRWKLNGDPIRFDHHGCLIDGQHRLWAVVEANKSIESYVITDLHPSVMMTIDTGKVRTFANHLQISGYAKYSACISAVCRLIIMEGISEDDKTTGIIGGGRIKPTQAELMTVARAHPDIVDSAEITQHRPCLAPHALLAYCHYKFADIDTKLADEWAHAFTTGENLPSTHPCLHLRNRMAGNRTMLRKMTRGEILALIIKSWNYLRNGKKCKNLRFSPTEAFPSIK